MVLTYGRFAEELRILPVDDLYLPEGDYSEDKIGNNPEGRRNDAIRYAEWFAETEPPPILVIQLDDGTLKVSDGHRRTAAAKLAGKQTIKAWVSYACDTGKVDCNGQPIMTGSTYELLNSNENPAEAV